MFLVIEIYVRSVIQSEIIFHTKKLFNYTLVLFEDYIHQHKTMLTNIELLKPIFPMSKHYY